MGRDRNSGLLEKRELSGGGGGGGEGAEAPSKRKSRRGREDSYSESDSGEDRSRSRRKARESSESEGKRDGKNNAKLENRKRKSRSRYSSEEDSDSDSESEDSGSESEESGLDSDSKSESEGERRRRKRRERKKREEERERKRRRKEKEKRRRKEKEEEKKRKEKRKKKQKEKKERGKKGPVTNLWGKYGIIRETDMWTKRPEFTAWLGEVKQVNLESLPNWEEKQMFKVFMEDHNTATFPSKKYYNLDAYYRHKMEKDQKKGIKKFLQSERTVFNDEEQRRQELMREREKQKAEEVETLKRSMQSGMAQAMKEQAQLREEMAYQYKIGNFEAAAAIQRRLDPDVAM
ncbi:RNA-binding protein 25 [Juglans regia]|uniref:RNA-binding protein 25 n=2 Tax=Juglans regia TaxID=51240 RepID=A0A2I4H2H9_JUGRE|nr:RNA-binding protein 25 [Juglans regia]